MNPLRAFKQSLERRRLLGYEQEVRSASRTGAAEAMPAGDGTLALDADALRHADETRTASVFVSVIIPSRDHPDVLARCVESLLATIDPGRDRVKTEIIVVDNGSAHGNRIATEQLLDSAALKEKEISARYLYDEKPFHFGNMCNRGAAEAAGDLLLFLNDDTQALDSGWLARMIACVYVPQTGAVGAKLLYPRKEDEPSARIQHCGIVNTRCGPVHKLNRLPDEAGCFLDYNHGVHRVIAVTGACLMIRRAIFEEAGGFHEAFPVSFNDVDLCYTLFEKGYTNLCCNEVRLTHYESVSRGDDGLDTGKMVRLAHEYRTLVSRHALLRGLDPYFPDGLTEGAGIAPEIRAEKEPLPFETAASKKEALSGRLKKMTRDACVRVGVEYAGPAANWMRADELRTACDAGKITREEASRVEADIWVRGYCFVTDADNALYEQKLLVGRMEKQEDGSYISPEEPPAVFALKRVYRPELVMNLPNQTNVAFCGFVARIPGEALKPGVYRVGIVKSKYCARQTLYNWGQTVLVHEPEKEEYETP